MYFVLDVFLIDNSFIDSFVIIGVAKYWNQVAFASFSHEIFHFQEDFIWMFRNWYKSNAKDLFTYNTYYILHHLMILLFRIWHCHFIICAMNVVRSGRILASLYMSSQRQSYSLSIRFQMIHRYDFVSNKTILHILSSQSQN